MEDNFFVAQSYGKALQKGSIPQRSGEGAETEVTPQLIFFRICFGTERRINEQNGGIYIAQYHTPAKFKCWLGVTTPGDTGSGHLRVPASRFPAYNENQDKSPLQTWQRALN
jgi:hypothetical protein